MKLVPATRKDTTGGRFYTIAGVQYPSVTTILGAIAKPALIPWAANQERTAVSEAAADLYQQWAADVHLRRIPLPRTAYLSTLHARLGTVRAHQKTLIAAGDIGSETHKLIEWTMRTAMHADAGPKPIVCDEARAGHQAFLTWAASVSLKPVLIERTVYSTAHGYAGTLDCLARVKGVLTILDFKTSKAIYPEAYLQSVAYQAALIDMGYLPPAGGGLIIRLPKTAGDPAFEVQAVPPVAELLPVFLAVKAVWEWSSANEARYRRRSA